MTHTVHAAHISVVRQAHPSAQIIRRTGVTSFTVFDAVDDARGHHSAVTIERGTITADGRVHVPEAA